MPPHNPSIQSYFPSTSSSRPTEATSSSSSSRPGDGFTAAELERALNPPVNPPWRPAHEYDEVEIAELVPGPRRVTFMGRIVNLYDRAMPSKAPNAARGCLKLIVKDNTGAITVRLWYARTPYHLYLGLLVSVWTPHISNGEPGSLAPPSAPFVTSIFPERDRGCHFMVHKNSDDGTLYNAPLRYQVRRPLGGLMTLKSFTDGGYEVEGAKILVCVKSLGPKKKFTNKKGLPSERVQVQIFDDTAEGTLDLWDTSTASAAHWTASNTVLLISSPGWHADRRVKIYLTSSTFIDVDPNIPDAEWLWRFAQRLTRREHVNPPFPEGVFDFEMAMSSPMRVKYLLADIDEFARSAPQGHGPEKFVGYLNVLVLETNIVSNFRRHMLMCNECCGIPIFNNSTSTACKQCDQPVQLRPNPKIIGTLVDETGSTSPGNLILSNLAWANILGQTNDELVSSPVNDLLQLEERLLYRHMTLVFGWAAEEENVGRLCVYDVQVC
ncbi:hypothetical protein BDY21DRAFT_292851 [Lineolata rhizophorae]|uniref:Nucleic acid-binding protein n=1 Tax=Lineolata rhizophorae TaxID=578093 RepID=A0A6A6NQ17_9PEZI|nr:hypothetical protein BDY21DRAFT_292851 [Lineolata rhizophorae]